MVSMVLGSAVEMQAGLDSLKRPGFVDAREADSAACCGMTKLDRANGEPEWTIEGSTLRAGRAFRMNV